MRPPPRASKSRGDIWEAQTIATLVLASSGIWILVVLITPLTAARLALVTTLALGLGLAAALAVLRAGSPGRWSGSPAPGLALPGLVIEAAGRPVPVAIGTCRAYRRRRALWHWERGQAW